MLRRLDNHTPRVRLPAGGVMWFMALAFLSAGIYMVGLPLGVWNSEQELDVPRWVAVAVGLIFLAPGAWMTLSLLDRRKPHANAAVWDRHRRWPRRRLPDESLRDIRIMAMWVLGLWLFLAPFNYFLWKALIRGKWLSPEVFGIGLFDLVALLMLAMLVYKVLGWLRHGRSHLELQGFPMPLGRKVRCRLLAPRSLRPGMQLTACLQAIEATWEEHGTRSKRQQKAVAYLLYEQEQALTVNSSGVCEMEWQLPQAPETVLGELPARYWELHVVAEHPGIDYRASFLLPVYRA